MPKKKIPSRKFPKSKEKIQSRKLAKAPVAADKQPVPKVAIGRPTNEEECQVRVATVPCNLGFENRTFLTEAEWRTYLRRKPVRYIRKPLMKNCEICGRVADEDNPFQNSHRISFDLGIVQLALTPEFLDGDKNIITAHRSTCNKSAELELEKAMGFLASIGITDLPEFLPLEIRALWAQVRKPPRRKRLPSGRT